MSKQEIIANIYYDKSGFGSKKTTLEDAKKKDKTIKMQDVEEFFKNNIEEKRKPRGQNSFVAPYAYHTFQIDLFFISKKDLENQKFRVGLVLIDVFSKYAVVVPIKSKEPPDFLAGMMEGLNKMDKKPELLYGDDEGTLNSQVVNEYLAKEKIELHRTRGHPAFAERLIRTFKDKLFKRVEADEKKEKQNIQWTDYIFEIMLTYNNKDVHSATQFTPKDARLKKNELEVKLNIGLQAKRSRTYPDLEKGDKVKVMRKKGISEKERSSHWLKAVQEITRIDDKLGQTYYFLDDGNRGYLRHELLKV